MKTSFRQKCGSALTHPLTIGALLTLLLNDLALKSLWPDHWITGKLSDLAFVVFSPPLLAFLLSHLCRRNPLAERGTFAASYVGLPLLYLAFNTFDQTHDWILQFLLPFTDRAAGSPLDPTDSIVIPFGLALALWIWERPPIKTEGLRARMCLFTAVVASISTVASSSLPPSPTQWLTGIGDDGAIIVEGPTYDYYESHDGGLTWTKDTTGQGRAIEWGSKEVGTPRGTYFIQGSGIMLSVPEGETKKVYSTAYLKESSNVWAQRYSTRRLRSGITDSSQDAERFIVAEPINITFDERTGNVIVSMGLQGALVGAADETWKRVAVGRFAPTDFSFSGKVHLLMLSANFWLSALAFSLSVIVVVLVISEPFDLSGGPTSILRNTIKGAIGVLLALALLLVIAVVSLYAALVTAVLYWVIMTVLSWRSPREGLRRRLIAIIYALCGIGFSVAGFPPFGGGAPSFVDTESLWATMALPFAVIAVAMFLPRRRSLVATARALAILNAFIVLSFVLWLTGGLILALATFASFVLTALTAFMLWRHLTNQNPYLES